MSIDILICTIDDGILDVANVLATETVTDVRYVVVMEYTVPIDTVACWTEAIERLTQRGDVTVTTLAGRGLARGRNCALDHATADIAVIADDDCRFTPEGLEAVRRAYAEHPEADIICLRATDYDGQLLRRYPNSPMTLSAAMARGYYPSSFEITLRRERVQQAGVRFNEHYGLGSGMFAAGEEDVFLADCAEAGLTQHFVPATMVATDPVTTGDNFLHDSRLQVTKGAVFRHCYGLRPALWRTLKEGAHYLVYHGINPLPIWRNMLHGVWTSR